MGNGCAKLFDDFYHPTTTAGTSNQVGTGKSPAGGGEQASGEFVRIPDLKKFSFEELKSATNSFRPDTVLGEGGFGKVFKGWVDERTYAPTKAGNGIPVAVKKCSSDSVQGFKEWQAEVRFLGRLRHPNLVKLLGYCWDENEFMLVYEFVQRGSLASHLFRKGDTIPWKTRIEIAIGAARGLLFLHTAEKEVICRDFKSANVLIDKDFNAKLSDFGFALFGPVNGKSHVSTKIVGTSGYAAPEYVSSGHVYVRSDVYSFGVVLLEIITGLRVIDDNRPNGQTNLVRWAVPCLTSKRKVKKIMDARLVDQYPMKSAVIMARLILKCLQPEPKNRPHMGEVLKELERINLVPMEPETLKIKS